MNDLTALQINNHQPNEKKVKLSHFKAILSR